MPRARGPPTPACRRQKPPWIGQGRPAGRRRRPWRRAPAVPTAAAHGGGGEAGLGASLAAAPDCRCALRKGPRVAASDALLREGRLWDAPAGRMCSMCSLEMQCQRERRSRAISMQTREGAAAAAPPDQTATWHVPPPLAPPKDPPLEKEGTAPGGQHQHSTGSQQPSSVCSRTPCSLQLLLQHSRHNTTGTALHFQGRRQPSCCPPAATSPAARSGPPSLPPGGWCAFFLARDLHLRRQNLWRQAGPCGTAVAADAAVVWPHRGLSTATAGYQGSARGQYLAAVEALPCRALPWAFDSFPALLACPWLVPRAVSQRDPRPPNQDKKQNSAVPDEREIKQAAMPRRRPGRGKLGRVD